MMMQYEAPTVEIVTVDMMIDTLTYSENNLGDIGTTNEVTKAYEDFSWGN